MARDRDRFNAAWRRWYANNAPRKRAWERRRREEIKAWWLELRAALSCTRCGEATPECLQFHHTDPRTKEIEVSLAVHYGWSKRRILIEMGRCIVLCANCHLIHHWNERKKLKSSSG